MYSGDGFFLSIVVCPQGPVMRRPGPGLGLRRPNTSIRRSAPVGLVRGVGGCSIPRYVSSSNRALRFSDNDEWLGSGSLLQSGFDQGLAQSIPRVTGEVGLKFVVLLLDCCWNVVDGLLAFLTCVSLRFPDIVV